MTVTPTVVMDLTNLTVAMDTSPENGTAVDATAEPPDSEHSSITDCYVI